MKYFQLLFLVACLSLAWAESDHDGRIDEALKRLNIIPGQKLLERYPKLNKKVVPVTAECYNTTIDGVGLKRVDIFEEDIVTVVKEYFKVNPNLINGLVGDEYEKRISSLIENLNHLMSRIFDCQAKPTERQQPSCVTSMTAFSPDEWDHLFTDQLSTPNLRQHDMPQHCSNEVLEIETLPTSINWKDNGFVNPPRNQGTCNTCYIFASVAATESAYYIRNQNNTGQYFSEQALLNCLVDYTKPEKDPCVRIGGAKGGWAGDVYRKMIDDGVTLEENCPYTNATHQCQEYPTLTKLKDYCLLFLFDEEALQALVARNGPTHVDIKIYKETFANLCPGNIYYGPCGPNDKTNHAVLVIGYDEDYWFLKNSFGTNWGDGGFFRMPRKGNVCKIETRAFVLTV